MYNVLLLDNIIIYSKFKRVTTTTTTIIMILNAYIYIYALFFYLFSIFSCNSINLLI